MLSATGQKPPPPHVAEAIKADLQRRPPTQIQKVSFEFRNSEEIAANSSRAITSAELFRDGVPHDDGPSSLYLGAALIGGKWLPCKTCQQTEECKGHSGHIPLTLKVLHPKYVRTVVGLLQLVCSDGHMVLSNSEKQRAIEDWLDDREGRMNWVLKKAHRESCYATVKQVDQKGVEADEAERLARCSNPVQAYEVTPEVPLSLALPLSHSADLWWFACQLLIRRIRHKRIEYADVEGTTSDIVPMDAILAKLKLFAQNERETEEHEKKTGKKALSWLELLGLPRGFRADSFVLSCVPVIPTRLRPSMAFGDAGRVRVHDITDLYQQLVQANPTNLALSDPILRNQLITCTSIVAKLFGVKVGGPAPRTADRPVQGIPFYVKGKKGVIRGGNMGKRVDYTGRTVIIIDPLIPLGTVQVPVRMCRKLTKPVKVTANNIEDLRKAVQNGPDQHLGALSVVCQEKGHLVITRLGAEKMAKSLKIGDVVNRHLAKGDWVIVNRQPTLHQGNWLALQAEVCTSDTLGFNPAIMDIIAGDCDGDEMTIHVPQTLEAESECRNLISIRHNLISPSSNKPAVTPKQDILILLYRLTSLDRYFTRNEAFSVFNEAIALGTLDQSSLPFPAIVKSCKGQLWTGTQIVSSLLPRCLNYDGKDAHGAAVCIRNGILMHGQLCSLAFKSHNGIIHSLVRSGEDQAAVDLISNLQIALQELLEEEGISIGLEDMNEFDVLVERGKNAEELRSGIERVDEKTRLKYPDWAPRAERDLERCEKAAKLREEFIQLREDAAAGSEADIDKLLARSDELARGFEEVISDRNAFKEFVTCGAKGSMSDLLGMLGAIGVSSAPDEAKRGTSPWPDHVCVTLSAYKHGMRPGEFFEQAQKARWLQVLTKIVTAVAGYLARRQTKAVESACVNSVMQVQDGEQIIGFGCGDDNGDPTRVVVQNMDGFFSMDSEKFSKLFEWGAEEYKTSDRGLLDGLRRSASLIAQDMLAIRLLRQEIISVLYRDGCLTGFDENHVPFRCDLQKFIDAAVRESMVHPHQTAEDAAAFTPAYVIRAVDNLVKNTLGKSFKTLLPESLALAPRAGNREALELPGLGEAMFRCKLWHKRVFLEYRLTKHAFDNMIAAVERDYMLSGVEPGQMVGLTAALSTSEPVTQKTLSNKHKHSRGLANYMELAYLKETPADPETLVALIRGTSKEAAEKFARTLVCTRASDVLQIVLLENGDDGKEICHKRCIKIRPHGAKGLEGVGITLPQIQDKIVAAARGYQKRLPVTMKRSLGLHKKVVKEASKKAPKKKKKKGPAPDEDIDESPEEILQWKIIASEEKTGVFQIGLTQAVGLPRRLAYTILRLVTEYLREELVLFGVPGITAAVAFERERYTVVESKGHSEIKLEKEWAVRCKGLNLREIILLPGVDHSRTYSNSVVEMYRVYGLEAGYACLVREMRNSSDITKGIDPRHFKLLADHATRTGVLLAFHSSSGKAEKKPPLQRIAYERPVEIAYSAALTGESDPLQTASSNQMVGRMPRGGTNSFELRVDVKKLIQHSEPCSDFLGTLECDPLPQEIRQYDYEFPAVDQSEEYQPEEGARFSPMHTSEGASFSPTHTSEYERSPSPPPEEDEKKAMLRSGAHLYAPAQPSYAGLYRPAVMQHAPSASQYYAPAQPGGSGFLAPAFRQPEAFVVGTPKKPAEGYGGKTQEDVAPKPKANQLPMYPQWAATFPDIFVNVQQKMLGRDQEEEGYDPAEPDM